MRDGKIGHPPAHLAPAPTGLEIAAQQIEQRQRPFRLGVTGIDRARPAVDRHGLVETMQVRERRALVAERADIGRPALQRAIEPGQRVLVAAEPVQDRAGIVANLGAGGIEAMRAFDVGQRLLRTLEIMEREGAHLQGRRVVRLQLVRHLQVGQRVGRASRPLQQRAGIVGGVAVARVELHHMLERRGGAIGAVQIDHDIGDGAPDVHGLGFQPRRMLERRQRVLELLLLAQHAAQRAQILRLRILRHRAPRPLRGEIEMLRIDRDQTHQVHGVGVRGIRGQRLLAAHLGVEHSSRAHMRDARFVKLGRFARGGSLAGSPAFATIHGPGAFSVQETAESVDDSVTCGKQAPHLHGIPTACSQARSAPATPPE